jgi:cellulose synthase/poly-beta-1,6-N-acetylglucosamine synthase-like glycosyltransferase
MADETVSGVMPVHNEARVLERVLDSVDSQGRKVDELILALDRCTDRSKEIAMRRRDLVIEVDCGNTAQAVLAGIRKAAGEQVILFDGNTLVPRDFVERLLNAMADRHADVVEWHGGLMALSKSTLDRFGPFSRRYLWTLEFFLRVQASGGTVVRLNGPHVRLRPSPLRRNLRYGLDYADLAREYDLAPYFRIGTKSGFVPDVVATVGVTMGYVRQRRLLESLARVRGFLPAR